MENGYSSSSAGTNDLHLLGKPFEWKHKKELGDTVLNLNLLEMGKLKTTFQK